MDDVSRKHNFLFQGSYPAGAKSRTDSFRGLCVELILARHKLAR